MDKTIYGNSPYEKHAAAGRDRMAALKQKKAYEDYKLRLSQDISPEKEPIFSGGGMASPSSVRTERLSFKNSPNQSMVLHSPSHHGARKLSPMYPPPRHQLVDQVDELDESMKQESERLQFISIKNDPESLLQQLKSSIFQEKQVNSDFKKRLHILQEQHQAQLNEVETRLESKYKNQILDLEATIARLQHQLKMTTSSLKTSQREQKKLQSTVDAILALAAPLSSMQEPENNSSVVEARTLETPNRMVSLDYSSQQTYQDQASSPKVSFVERSFGSSTLPNL